MTNADFLATINGDVPADLDAAEMQYMWTRAFMQDAIDALAATDPADLGPILRVQIGRWWRQQPGYRTVLDDLVAGDG